MSHPTKKGFTLVELLIVMAILAILMTLGIASFQSARLKARDAKRKSDLATIAKSLEAYVNDYNRYPASSGGIIVCNSAAGTTCAWGSAFQDSKGTIYAATLPKDSVSVRTYRYESASGDDYTIYAALENTKDPAIETLTGISCGTGITCNYRIKSSNNISP